MCAVDGRVNEHECGCEREFRCIHVHAKMRSMCMRKCMRLRAQGCMWMQGQARGCMWIDV